MKKIDLGTRKWQKQTIQILMNSLGGMYPDVVEEKKEVTWKDRLANFMG